MRKSITWTVERMKQLHDAREAAIKRNETAFKVKIEGQGEHEFDTGYARHLLTYLAEQFTNNKPQVYPENREGKEP